MVDANGGLPPKFMLRGARIGLAAVQSSSLEMFARWMSDLAVTRTLAAPKVPMTVERERTWLDAALQRAEPFFTIYRLDTMQPIGNTDLYNVDMVSLAAEFGIMIGERSAWGQGYATEATRLMMEYAFDVLGLEHLSLQVYAPNVRAASAYQRAGFKEVGRLRGAKRIGRERYDIIVMDAVPDDIPRSALHRMMQTGSLDDEQE